MIVFLLVCILLALLGIGAILIAGIQAIIDTIREASRRIK